VIIEVSAAASVSADGGGAGFSPFASLGSTSLARPVSASAEQPAPRADLRLAVLFVGVIVILRILKRLSN
jgi:hypothetical protein